MFAYDDAVATRYPTIRAGVVLAAGLANGPALPALLDESGPNKRLPSGSYSQGYFS